MNQRLAFPLLASLTWALAACGSTSSSATGSNDGGNDAQPAGDGGPASDDGSASDSGVSATQACADYAQARCTRLDACSNATYTVVHYGSQAQCVSAITTTCANGLAAPQTAATPSFFEGCATALAADSCANLLGDNPPPACATLAGPLANAAPCFSSAQCQSTYCAVPSTASCGVCAAVPVAGAACLVDADCGSRGSMVCSDADTCVVMGISGAACSKGAPCGVGLSCVGADAKKNVTGLCDPAASTVGATCDATKATGPGCDATLSLDCDAATSLCVADTLVGASQVCGDVGGGEARCEAAGTCVIPADDAGVVDAGAGDAEAGAAAPTTGTCLAAAANSAACDSANGPACLAPAKCVTGDSGTAGTCQLPDPTGCQ